MYLTVSDSEQDYEAKLLRVRINGPRDEGPDDKLPRSTGFIPGVSDLLHHHHSSKSRGAWLRGWPMSRRCHADEVYR